MKIGGGKKYCSLDSKACLFVYCRCYNDNRSRKLREKSQFVVSRDLNRMIREKQEKKIKEQTL